MRSAVAVNKFLRIQPSIPPDKRMIFEAETLCYRLKVHWVHLSILFPYLLFAIVKIFGWYRTSLTTASTLDRFMFLYVSRGKLLQFVSLLEFAWKASTSFYPKQKMWSSLWISSLSLVRSWCYFIYWVSASFIESHSNCFTTVCFLQGNWIAEEFSVVGLTKSLFGVKI